MAAVPLHPPSLPTVVGRALRVRCPRCGLEPLFAGAFRMHAGCGACGYRYEREQGYWVGAIYLNFAFTVLFGFGPVLVLDILFGLTLAQQLTLAIVLAVLVPLALFRYSRSLWLAIDYLVTSWDERASRPPPPSNPRSR